MIRVKTKMSRLLERVAIASGLKFSSFLLSFMLLLLLSAPAESACVYDTLKGVDADTLLMDSNEVYQLLDDPRAVNFWLPLSRVTICDQIGNVDDDIGLYYEIRNQDANQSVRALRER
jgi:hypothetical protein